MFEFQLKDLCASSLPLAVQFRNTPLRQSIHRHDAIELVHILHGAGWCAIDGMIHPMATGDLYVIPVGTTHEYYGDGGLSYVNCLFNEDVFHADEQELYQCFLANSPGRLAAKYTLGPARQQELSRLFEELHAELNQIQPHHLLLARSLFIQIIIFIMRNATQTPGLRASASQKQLGRVLAYISDHLPEKITVGKLAEIAEYRAAYLPKLFRREIGCGIKKYIQTQRLERAAAALGNTADTVEYIAFDNGFFDASHFVKVFKKQFGLTPLKYREKIRAEKERQAMRN